MNTKVLAIEMLNLFESKSRITQFKMVANNERERKRIDTITKQKKSAANKQQWNRNKM